MGLESADERAISLRGVPVIDVSPLITAASKSNKKETNNNVQDHELQLKVDRVVKEISDACKNWGFYYAVGHGIERSLIQTLKDQSKKFINMPKEFKRKVLRQEVTEKESVSESRRDKFQVAILFFSCDFLKFSE